MKTIALTLTAFALLSFTVRAEDKADKLVGKWEATKGPVPAGSIAEFTKDGKLKVTIKGAGKAETKEATYKLDGETIKVTSKDVVGKERTESFKVKKLTDKELVIVDKGKDIEFKKVK